MIEFILVYSFFASCMAIVAYSITNKTDWFGLLIVSLFTTVTGFLVASLFSMLIK